MSSSPPAQDNHLVFGVHPVQELMRQRGKQLQELLVSREAKRLGSLVEQARALGVKVQQVSAEELTGICDSASHQGVAAIVGKYSYAAIEDLIETERPPLLLVVDGVTDPQNLGAMFRSAFVLGCTGVVLTRDRCAGVSPAVVRVSSGATEHLPCAQVTNLARALGQLKAADVWVAATVESDGMDPADADLTGRLALVLGNEHKGIRPIVRRACDFELTIPSSGAIASLNVAAATTALFYEAARQRRRQ